MKDKNNIDIYSSRIVSIALLIIFGAIFMYYISVLNSFSASDYEPTENINIITKEGDHFLLYEEYRDAFTQQYYSYKICEVKNGDEITITEDLTRRGPDKLTKNSPYKYEEYIYKNTKVKIYLIQNFILFKTDKDINYKLTLILEKFDKEGVKEYSYLIPFYKKLLKNNDPLIYIPAVIFLIKIDNVESFKNICETIENVPTHAENQRYILDYIKGYPHSKKNKKQMIEKLLIRH